MHRYQRLDGARGILGRRGRYIREGCEMRGNRKHLHYTVRRDGQTGRGGYDPRSRRAELGAGHAHGSTVAPTYEYQGACEDPQTQEQYCEETLATHALHSMPGIQRVPCMKKTTLCLQELRASMSIFPHLPPSCQEPRASGQYFHIFHPLVNLYALRRKGLICRGPRTYLGDEGVSPEMQKYRRRGSTIHGDVVNSRG